MKTVRFTKRCKAVTAGIRDAHEIGHIADVSDARAAELVARGLAVVVATWTADAPATVQARGLSLAGEAELIRLRDSFR